MLALVPSSKKSVIGRKIDSSMGSVDIAQLGRFLQVLRSANKPEQVKHAEIIRSVSVAVCLG